MPSRVSSLPEKAGVAELHLVDEAEGHLLEGRMWPRLDGETIFLPANPQNRCYLLPGDETLVGSFPSPRGKRYFFFGTDERPFCTEIAPNAFELCETEGPGAFYESLCPQIMKDLRNYGRRVERQGDVWFGQIAETWEGLEPIFKMFAEIRPRQLVTKFDVLWTTHQLTGQIMPAEKIRKVHGKKGGQYRHEQFWLASGVLEAPDHRPRELVGVNVLARTTNLMNNGRGD